MTNKERYHALEDFANFVAHEIFDEEWDYNCTESFPELVCRKLLKLQIIGANKDNYVLFDTKRNKNETESWILLEKKREEISKSEWLWVGFDKRSKIKWSCPKCGRGVEKLENFCPNCGVRLMFYKK